MVVLFVQCLCFSGFVGVGAFCRSYVTKLAFQVKSARSRTFQGQVSEFIYPRSFLPTSGPRGGALK